MISGLHWRNADPLGEDAFGIFSAGGFGSCVVMSNMGAELPQEIARRYPDTLIIGRLYWPPGDLPSHGEALDRWLDYIDETRHVATHYQILNEPDYEYKDVTPEDFAEWFAVMCCALQASYPRLKFGFPMPSIQGEQSMDYIQRSSEGIEIADFLADRGYWEQPWQMHDWHWGKRFLKAREMFPTKPIYLCEYGCSAELEPTERAKQYREYLLSLPDWIGSANAYIQAKADGWRLFWIGADLAQEMRVDRGNGESGFQDEAVNAPGETPELQDDHNGGGNVLKEQYVDLFAQWDAAGGVENNFRKHLLGIGAIQPTAGDLQFLAREAEAGLSQLKGALASYPFK